MNARAAVQCIAVQCIAVHRSAVQRALRGHIYNYKYLTSNGEPGSIIVGNQTHTLKRQHGNDVAPKKHTLEQQHEHVRNTRSQYAFRTSLSRRQHTI